MNKQITGSEYSKNFGQIVSRPTLARRARAVDGLVWAVVVDDSRGVPTFVSEPITWAGLSFKRAAHINNTTTDELTRAYVVEAKLSEFAAA